MESLFAIKASKAKKIEKIMLIFCAFSGTITSLIVRQRQYLSIIMQYVIIYLAKLFVKVYFYF